MLQNKNFVPVRLKRLCSPRSEVDIYPETDSDLTCPGQNDTVDADLVYVIAEIGDSDLRVILAFGHILH